jgi:hypothetical protein
MREDDIEYSVKDEKFLDSDEARSNTNSCRISRAASDPLPRTGTRDTHVFRLCEDYSRRSDEEARELARLITI